MATSTNDKIVRGADISTIGKKMKEKLTEKQNLLISGENIKTINNTSILGAGNLTIHDGVDGQDGKSAYQSWLDEGNVGTEADFIASLQGNSGVVIDGVTEETFVSDLIVNSLSTGGATKALSAEMGKDLNQMINGVPSASTTVTVPTTAGTKIENTTKYDLSLTAGKSYWIAISGLGTYANQIEAYLYDSSGNAVQAYWSGHGSTASHESYSSTITSRSLVPVSDVSKISFYATSANVIETGSLTVTATSAPIKGIVDEIDDIQDLIAEGYQYRGVATPETNPSSLDQKIFYLAGAGAYANFDSLEIEDGNLGILKYASGEWSVDTIAVGNNYDSEIKQLNELLSDLNGVEPFSEETSVTVTNSGVPKSTKHELALSAGIRYTFTVDFNGCIPTITMYAYDSNSRAVRFYIDNQSSSKTNVSFSSSYNPRYITPVSDIASVAFYAASSSVVSTGTVTVDTYYAGEEGMLEEMDNRISALESKPAGDSGGHGDSVMKDIISASRPYYFNMGWSGDSLVAGYLDNILRTVPDGKHFLCFTDIHVDYGFSTSGGIFPKAGIYQNQAPIVKYVYDRLGKCKVVCLGDVIGSQSTENGAESVLDWFSEEYYSRIGKDFIFSLGDHDTNNVSGGIVIPETTIYNKLFRPAFQYGAVADTVAESKIPSISGASDGYKTALTAWNRMHFYVDDPINKIRFISFDDQAQHKSISNAYTRSGIVLPFIANAMQSAPDDYDIVVCAHEYYLRLVNHNFAATGCWERQLFDLLSAFKTRGSFSLSKPSFSSDYFSSWWNYIMAEDPNSFNFSNKVGRVIAIFGDKHYDDAFYVNGSDNAAIEWTPTLSVDDDYILTVLFDRCNMEQRGSTLNSESSTNALPYATAARNNTAEDPRYQTVEEVLLDVVTITDDDKVVCTRIGPTGTSGSPGRYPLFDPTVANSIGDIVVHNAYAWKFTSAHIAGDDWNENSVELYYPTEQYVRIYDI